MTSMTTLDIKRISESKANLPLIVCNVADTILNGEPYLELKQLVKKVSNADLSLFHTAVDILAVDPDTMKMPLQVYQMHLVSTVTIVRMVSTMLSICAGEDYHDDEVVSRIGMILIHALDLEFQARCGLITYDHNSLSITELDQDLKIVKLVELPEDPIEKDIL